MDVHLHNIYSCGRSSSCALVPSHMTLLEFCAIGDTLSVCLAAPVVVGNLIVLLLY